MAIKNWKDNRLIGIARTGSGLYSDGGGAGEGSKDEGDYYEDPGAYGGTRYRGEARGASLDTSRRPELAGQTVSYGGLNYTYDKLGYVTSVTNSNHVMYAGTNRSVSAPSRDAALAAANGTARGSGSDHDRQYLSDNELANIEHMRSLARTGAITWQQANEYANGIRAKYGYSGGADGSAYEKLPYIVFDPENWATQPLSPSFGSGVKPTTEWTPWWQTQSEGPDASGAALRRGGAWQEPGGEARIGGAVKYNAPSGGSSGESVADEREAAIRAAVERAVAELLGQKSEVNEGYRDLNRQNYLNKMEAQKDIDQYLAAHGITGGAAESTRLGLNASYAEALRRAEQSRLGSLADLDRAIMDTRYRGETDVANARASAAQYAEEMAWKREQAEREWQYRLQQQQYQQQQAQQQQQYRQQQQQQSNSYALAMQLLQSGVMPDAQTLAAAGLTQEQAQLLLREKPAYVPTFTQAQVLDAARRGTLTGNMLRDYNYYVYGDPNYGGTGAGGGTGGSGGPSGGSGGSSGGGTSKGVSDREVIAAAKAYAQRNPAIDPNSAAFTVYLNSLGYSDAQKQLFLEYLRYYCSSGVTDPRNPGTTIEVN